MINYLVCPNHYNFLTKAISSLLHWCMQGRSQGAIEMLPRTDKNL